MDAWIFFRDAEMIFNLKKRDRFTPRMRDEDTVGDIKMVPEERRSKRIAGPYPVGDISFSGEQERALSRFPIRFSHFAALTRPSRERTITFFLFSFNYRCQGVALPSPSPLRRPSFYPAAPVHLGAGHPLFPLARRASIIPLFIPIICTTWICHCL